MCGICGVYFNDSEVDRDKLVRMRDAMAHRGPDEAGLFISSNHRVGLANRRLSIIDLISGSQPMSSTDGRYTLVTNGEIYNYLELKNELKQEYNFTTTSDTEVLLACFLKWGRDCLPRLNGMFAFAIYDKLKQSIFLARDPAGVKPLYYHQRSDGLSFASEIKSLLCYDRTRGRLNPTGLADYLVFQYTLEEKTLFKDISKLLPGCWLEISPGGISTGSYFNIEFNKKYDNYSDAATDFQSLFSDSVRLQMRSDVPLGGHLSGGLDTGLIASEATGQSNAVFHTFTASFAEGGVFDDSTHAAITAEHVGSRHHLVQPDKEDFLEIMPKLIWHMDEPAAGEGLYPQYRVSKLATEHVKVVLGGQGADETFGGYTRYFMLLYLAALEGAITGRPLGDGLCLADLHNCLPQLKRYYPLWASVFSGSSWPDPTRFYFNMINRCPDITRVFSPDFIGTLDGYRPETSFFDIIGRPDSQISLLDRVLYFETTQWLPALLHVEDRMSMACSLESRVPFLDHRLTQLAFATPPEMKMKGGETKSLIRRIARRRLPLQIADRRDKIGFPVPIHKWDLSSKMDELYGEAPAELKAIFLPEFLNKCTQTATMGDRRLWAWFCLRLWWNAFLS